MREKKRKKKTATLLLIGALLIGLSLLLYPTVSSYLNSLNQTKEMASYSSDVERMDAGEYERILSEAKEYNARLAEREDMYALPPWAREQYGEQLKLGSSDVMGVLTIPAIKVDLPIYHGTSEAVLNRGAGHLEWSSLPVGGESSHAVITGHRGHPSSWLLTDLAKLETGDRFMIRVLGETLVYEVERITSVLPEVLTPLAIEQGEDLCTLITCTPYGVNTHRLLVIARRTDPEQSRVYTAISEAVEIDPVIVAPILSIPLIAALLIAVMADGSRRRTGQGDDSV